MTLSVLCRICKKKISFNNALHVHLRLRCNKFTISIKEQSKSALTKISSKQFIYFENVKISVIQFKIGFNQNIDTKYDFRNWQYVTTKLTFNENVTSTLKCINSDANITLTNITFVKIQTKNCISIRIMTTSITVRDFETSKHLTDRYAIISIYFKNKNKFDKNVRIMIIKEIHLINDLKINILLENYILNSKLFDISMLTATAYIENCNVTISIKIIN